MSEVYFGPPYQKINTVFKRGEDKRILLGDWALPEFEYLQDTKWEWTEKVDGTNIRLHWNGERVTVGGRTDNAQIPAPLLDRLKKRVEDTEVWRKVFGSNAATVYGEGYGSKIQNGSHYRSDQELVVFDVRIGTWWLHRDDVRAIARDLGMKIVPIETRCTLNEAIERVCAGKISSAWLGASIEGVVGTTIPLLNDRKGERIIAKIKVKDFAHLREQS